MVPASDVNFASPTSEILAWSLVALSRMLGVFRSMWTMFLLCRWYSPLTMSSASFAPLQAQAILSHPLTQ